MSFVWSCPQSKNVNIIWVLPCEAITKVYKETWNCRPDDIKVQSKRRSSGWIITGKVDTSTCLPCVRQFTAVHDIHGQIKGDYNNKVVASSKVAFDHFYKHHPPTKYDTFDD